METQQLLRQIEQAGACIALLNKPTAEALQESIQVHLPKGMEIEDLKVSYADILDGKLTLTTTLVIGLSSTAPESTPTRRTRRTKAEIEAAEAAAKAATPPAPPAPPVTAPEPPAPPQ